MTTTTIVSAFINFTNEREDIKLYNYYEYGKLLLQSTTPKIIFLDDLMMQLIGDNYDKTNTILLKIDTTDLYLNQYKQEITQFKINTDNPKKDNMNFMFIMCNKTEWMKKAILLNNFNTTDFIWIDFGIRHVFSCNDNDFVNKIDQLYNKRYTNIRIGSIWDVNMDHTFQYYLNNDIYKNIAWYFAGGIFGGNNKLLLVFAEKMKQKCIDIILSKHTIMWETNIWYLIYLENKELFDVYTCDHNDSIIDCY